MLQLPKEVLGFENVVHGITDPFLFIHPDAGYERERSSTSAKDYSHYY